MPSTEYFVGWRTLALINAGLAQGKNRSGTNWFAATPEPSTLYGRMSGVPVKNSSSGRVVAA